MLSFHLSLQEFAPSDEELLAYRRGEEWDPEKAKELAKQKVCARYGNMHIHSV